MQVIIENDLILWTLLLFTFDMLTWHDLNPSLGTYRIV